MSRLTAPCHGTAKPENLTQSLSRPRRRRGRKYKCFASVLLVADRTFTANKFASVHWKIRIT